jgi:hypothetical protein
LYEAFEDHPLFPFPDNYCSTDCWKHLIRWESVIAADYIGYKVTSSFIDEHDTSQIVDMNDVSTTSEQHHVYPRIQQDKLAMRCLDNINTQLEARSLMNSESRKAKVLERRILEACGQCHARDNAKCDDDNNVSFGLSLTFNVLKCF